jgi:mRNA interferase YafQ
MRTIDRSTAFRRDFGKVRASPGRRDVEARLEAILELLAADRPLPPANRDHALSGS